MKFCECGCGQATMLAKETSRRDGHIKGQPFRFIHGHNVLHRWGDALERFHSKIMMVTESGCWIWLGTISGKAGYGRFNWNGRESTAHTFAYEYYRGPVPPGKELDHLCRVRSCANPHHLEAVTHRENILRGESPMACNAKKTQCPAGHPYDEANTYRKPGSGYRECRICIGGRSHAAV
jgi:hypothetical protein